MSEYGTNSPSHAGVGAVWFRGRSRRRGGPATTGNHDPVLTSPALRVELATAGAAQQRNPRRVSRSGPSVDQRPIRCRRLPGTRPRRPCAGTGNVRLLGVDEPCGASTITGRVKCRLPAASVHPAEDSRIDFRRLDESITLSQCVGGRLDNLDEIGHAGQPVDVCGVLKALVPGQDEFAAMPGE
jgi:hypothetical protein